MLREYIRRNTPSAIPPSKLRVLLDGCGDSDALFACLMVKLEEIISGLALATAYKLFFSHLRGGLAPPVVAAIVSCRVVREFLADDAHI